ncbi:MAG: PH domain-containing protein [Thermoguttaceae bacterium]|nr:PH domain-containing protein [Thermoguttaceae bacterium]
MAKTNANAPAGPWREGRPSFKAFYPEIVFLTIVTIAFIALAARLSCSETKPTAENAEPTPVSSATLFSAPQAFAQEVSLDAPVAAEETLAPQTDDVSAASGADLNASVAAPTEDVVETPAPVEETVEPAAPQKAKSALPARILAIWGVCLGIPALLWIWRAWNWLVAVYGVRFEIRCDADNPKATTFLVTRGIFNKKTDSLHIAQIKDIQSLQSLWQKYFQGGVGTIRLTTSDVSDPVLEMKHMDEPSRVFNALDALRRHYWGRGGMQVNADGSELPLAGTETDDVAM